MKELKQRLKFTEQENEKKQIMKEIDLKDIKRKLAHAIYVSSYVYTIDYYEVTCSKKIRCDLTLTHCLV